MNSSPQNLTMQIDVYSKLQYENQTTTSPFVPILPTIPSFVADVLPLPYEALLLGFTSKSLPVLLNLHNPNPGPLLIITDPGAGKTALLQFIAQASMEMHSPEETQFGVLTNYPDEWGNMAGKKDCVGIFPTYQPVAEDFLYSLSSWACITKANRQSILLFFDDLENIDCFGFEARQTLRWLLLHGPSKQIWPIITVGSKCISRVAMWLDSFRTRIFGQIRDVRLPNKFTSNENSNLPHLQASHQFSMRENDGWLKFWIPETNHGEDVS